MCARFLQIFIFLTLFFANIATAGKLVVVLDAGHGGHDPGAPGAVTNEKTIVLGVALKLGEILKQQLGNNVNVIFTRDADFFVPLGNRAQIANKANADIFVSIHANSVGDIKRRSIVQGASVYVRGFSSSKQASEVAAFENASLKYEKKTSASAEQSIFDDLLWNRHLEHSIRLADLILESLVTNAGRKRGTVEQNDFAVLRLTKMPAVLIELDYICNPAMEKFMLSEQGQHKMAHSIATAINAFHSGTTLQKAKNNSSASQKQKPAKETATASETKADSPQNRNTEPATAAPSDAETFKIQFLISKNPLPPGSPKLKGLTGCEYYVDGSTLKYTVGSYPTMKEANANLPGIKKLFPDAFVIKLKNGKRIK